MERQPTGPTHPIARDQLKGYGTIISFEVRGAAAAAAADTVCSAVRLIQHATSLGAVESTIKRRASIPGQEHLPLSLLRLSVGIENVDDIWADLDAALKERIATGTELTITRSQCHRNPSAPSRPKYLAASNAFQNL